MSRHRSVVMFLTLAAAAPAALAQSSTAERSRAIAGLPNWTGLWETELSAMLSSGEPPGTQPGGAAAGPATAPNSQSSSEPGATEDPFVVLLRKRVALLRPPPHTAPESERARDAGDTPPPPTPIVCKWGFPAIVESPVPDGMFQVFVTPEETLFLYRNGEVRHIYTDGRNHPRKDDLWPTAMGDSIGHWAGQTLLIDTISRTAGPVVPGLPNVVQLSARAHFSERFRRIDANTMSDDLTIEDPERLEQPWRISVRYRRVTDLDRMIHTDCTENERNIVVDGKVTIVRR